MSLQTLSLAIASPGERTVRRPSREYCQSATILFHMESSVKYTYLIFCFDKFYKWFTYS